MIRTACRFSRHQRGVSILAALFFMLLFAAISAAMVSLTTTGNASSTQDFQGSRAYQAARAGVEWALYQVLDPTNATATSPTATLPSCPTAVFPGVPGLTVAQPSCTAYPLSAPGYYEEGTKRIRIYEVSAVATAAGPGAGIERKVTVRVEKCRDTASTIFPYDCQ